VELSGKSKYLLISSLKTAKSKFLFISSLKTAVILEKEGFNKKKYLEWCSEIWESMKFIDPNELEDTLKQFMEKDVSDLLKTL
jgi:hypothetical protein